MVDNKSMKTRKLSSDEIKRIRFDLTFRGWLSLISAAMVVVFAVIMTIHGMPLFKDRSIVPICVPAIWIAAVAVDFGLLRSGLQYLKWRKGHHTGVVEAEGIPKPSLLDDILNLIIFVVFVAFGIIVLFSGKLGFGDAYTLPQIPLSILSITFGMTSGETARLHFWLRKVGLVDVIHKVE